MKILILGITGMLGHTVFKRLSENINNEVWGTLRSKHDKVFFPGFESRIFAGIDVSELDQLKHLLSIFRPEMVINCIGVVKQLAEADDPLKILPVNSLFPHQLSGMCAQANCRMVHISTDCVFSGKKGQYLETDVSDAEDLYGKSKCIGEVINKTHVLTLRTSIIGRELKTEHSLINWFLAQEGSVKGYTKAFFSGLPTCELARVIADFILPDSRLTGLFHVAAEPISKFDLLQLVAAEYGKRITIVPDSQLKIDRSLNGKLFCEATGYQAPAWSELIQCMHRQQ
jgi:dTDP-4-dehydrorhamnose reductase